MKSRWWLAFDMGLILLTCACTFWLGRQYEHRKDEARIDAYAYAVQSQSDLAQRWRDKAELSEPLIRQWRMGYEGLKKTCPGKP